jgi:hypothetical protein
MTKTLIRFSFCVILMISFGILVQSCIPVGAVPGPSGPEIGLPIGFSRFHDSEKGVTCWYSGYGIFCIPDKELK